MFWHSYKLAALSDQSSDASAYLTAMHCLTQGNPDAPRCGFSQKVVSALRSIKVPFNSFDILTDEEVRQGLKEYSQWPTYPQLYVKGELLGGCDVILEMQQDGKGLIPTCLRTAV